MNGAVLILALSVRLSALLSWRVDRTAQSTSIRVTAVAVATMTMIAAIPAGGSHTTGSSGQEHLQWDAAARTRTRMTGSVNLASTHRKT